MTTKQPEYFISTDKTMLDINMIHSFLSKESYWAKNISLATVEQSIQHSFCFGVYSEQEQAGFARVITDHATFAYLADVFIANHHRRKGLSKLLMENIMHHPELQGLRRWMLATRDAHSLYSQFGWEPLSSPERWMQIYQPDIY